jgi:hypothetical protein
MPPFSLVASLNKLTNLGSCWRKFLRILNMIQYDTSALHLSQRRHTWYPKYFKINIMMSSFKENNVDILWGFILRS